MTRNILERFCVEKENIDRQTSSIKRLIDTREFVSVILTGSQVICVWSVPTGSVSFLVISLAPKSVQGSSDRFRLVSQNTDRKRAGKELLRTDQNRSEPIKNVAEPRQSCTEPVTGTIDLGWLQIDKTNGIDNDAYNSKGYIDYSSRTE